MPVILEPEQFEPWLTGAAGLELLKPVADDVLQCWPVSRRVNSWRAPDDDNPAGGDIEGGKQRRRSIAFVVVGHSPGPPFRAENRNRFADGADGADANRRSISPPMNAHKGKTKGRHGPRLKE